MNLARLILRGLFTVLALSPLASAASQDPPELANSIHLRWGYPGGNCLPLPQEFYVICADTAHRVPLWVTYHLASTDLRSRAKRKNNFHADRRLPDGGRSENADYRGSGYDKGHMAPAADFKRSPSAMSETFLLSNMAPQRPNLNRRIWERLENAVRELARAHGSIWIFTGPLYLNAAGTSAIAPDSFIGTNRVAVPTHFFKIVLCEHSDGGVEMFAFIMPNQEAPFTNDATHYLVSADRIERLSGLDFFARLPDTREEPLEAATAVVWPVAR